MHAECLAPNVHQGYYQQPFKHLILKKKDIQVDIDHIFYVADLLAFDRPTRLSPLKRKRLVWLQRYWPHHTFLDFASVDGKRVPGVHKHAGSTQ